MSKQNTTILLVALLFLGVVAFSVTFFLAKDSKDSLPVVTNFEECAAAGNPIMESMPEQCRHGDTTYTKIYEVLTCEAIEGCPLPEMAN